ncbi:MAG: TolC family protein [Marinilabiliales bacterium]|nr:TolC family protein [Marinilabiliales bacterium]
MTRILILFALLSIGTCSLAQQADVMLTLNEAIDMASRQSLDAFKQQNMYLASYWEYKYYRSDMLPQFSIGANPLSYNNSIRQDYVPQDQNWQYSQQKNITSSASMKMTQNVGLTGGSFSASSDIGMVKNFLGDKTTLFSSNMVSIGYKQRLNGYNSLRWKSKIEPLKFETAKKKFIQSREDIAIKTTGKFFTLVDAQIELNIARTNLANSDTLYQIGKGRYQVGTLTQDELLNFELNLMNAKIAMTRAQQGLVRARSDLNIFLGLDKNTLIDCVLPKANNSGFQVNVEDAIQKAMDNNPDIMAQERQLLEQESNVRYVRAQNGLSADISAMAGLNQKSTILSEAYQNPNQFQNIALAGVSIPILDWGRRKGQIKMAKSNRDVVVNTVKQARIDFEQSVLMNVMEFNLQSEMVSNSAKADTIAQMGFDVTMRRFKIGKLDVTKLNLARNDLETARRAYIAALRKYWSSYYLIRELSLYDFEKKSALTADFDKILEQ